MCDYFQWEKDNRDRKDAHDDFKTALVQQFNTVYGTDDTRLETWQGLCRALNVDPLPTNATEAVVVSASENAHGWSLMVDRSNRYSAAST